MLVYKKMRENKWRFDRGLDLENGDDPRTYESEYEHMQLRFRHQSKLLEKIASQIKVDSNGSFAKKQQKLNDMMKPKWYQNAGISFG